MKRYGSVIQIHPDKIGEYNRLHAKPWPEVVTAIREANIANYSIYLRKLPDGNHYLFSYFEYVGHDFAGDMARMAALDVIQKWWDLCKPCHVPLPDRIDGEWWATMVEVFHSD